MILLIGFGPQRQEGAAQPPIQWQNTIGGSLGDRLQSIQQTSDGGYILGGFSDSPISGDKNENSQGFDDYWVMKLDASGAIQWQNTIGGSGNDRLFSIQQTNDGGYVLGGWSASDSTGDKNENSQGAADYWVVKLDTSGAIQWQNTIGGSDLDYLYSIQQTSDGGYILGGYSLSNVSGDKNENSQGMYDYWVVKLDTSGAIQWQNTIGGSADDYLFSIQQTSDGGYVLGGYSWSDISGDKTENSQGLNDYWVVKLDSLGAIQWQNTIGGSGGDILYSIQQTSDGGYVLGGLSSSNISGDKTDTSRGGTDYWVVKLDTAGIIQWQNTIGGDSTDYFQSIQQTSDGGYVLGGYSWSNISGDKIENNQGIEDYWVVKLCGADTTNISQSICAGDSALVFGVYQSTAGTYYNTLTNINGCDSIVITDLIVNPIPTVVIIGDTIACESILLDEGFGIQGDTYLWSTTEITQTITVTVSGIYSLTVTDVNGCQGSDSINVTVNPTYSIADPAIEVCNGDSVSIYGTFRSITGTYYDSSTTTNGCDSIYSTVLTVDPLPTFNLGADTTICNSCSITLDAGGGFTSYNWSTGDSAQTISVDSAGTYIVTVTDTNSCIGTDTITITIATGINPQSSIHNPKLDVHPNPNTGEFTVTFKIIEKQHINLKVFDIKGQVIYEENLSDFTGEYQNKIDMSGYAKGIYSLQLSTKEKTINKKIIFE